MDRGAFMQDETGRLTLNSRKVLPVLNDLAHELLIIEAEGDYARAEKLVNQYRQITPVMQEMIDRLQDVPIDIRPSYPAAEELLSEWDVGAANVGPNIVTTSILIISSEKYRFMVTRLPLHLNAVCNLLKAR